MTDPMTDPVLAAEVRDVATATGFSGVVRVDRDGAPVVLTAHGLAHRGHDVANTVDTRFGIASGTKTLTALTVMRLVEQGALRLSTPARELLGDDLPLIGSDVTVEHLLAHRSGIGDYLDEEQLEDVTQHVLTVPVHRLATTTDYLEVLDGHPSVFPAGERFAYCNSGYVVLALLAERATGATFADLVRRLVCEPAGATATGFERSDETPPGMATGYLDATGHRTNVLHLPVVGSGDGGASSTAADVHAIWRAATTGRVVSPGTFAEMVRPRSEAGSHRYGLGVWLDTTTGAWQMEGADAGVSFRSVHDPSISVTWTVVSNTSEGAWPVARGLRTALAAG